MESDHVNSAGINMQQMQMHMTHRNETENIFVNQNLNQRLSEVGLFEK